MTLRTPVSIEGIGLHTGHRAIVHFRPAPEDHGIVFHRRDFPRLPIPVRPESAMAFDHATTLGVGTIQISTVEHTLSAAYALGIDNLDIEIEGPEVPILDGSALPFVRLFQAAGLERQRRHVRPITVAAPIDIVRGDKRISIRPAATLTICYAIDFPHRAIGGQKLTVEVTPETYAANIAPARTFGFLQELDYLRQKGLARGGSLHNAVVLDEENILSGPLRFPDEFVRHKILDLLGDLALLGRPLQGRIEAHRAGHALHSELVRRILAPSVPLLATPSSASARA